MSALLSGTVYCPTCGTPVEVYAAVGAVENESDGLRVRTFDALGRHKCKAKS